MSWDCYQLPCCIVFNIVNNLKSFLFSVGIAKSQRKSTLTDRIGSCHVSPTNSSQKLHGLAGSVLVNAMHTQYTRSLNKISLLTVHI